MVNIFRLFFHIEKNIDFRDKNGVKITHFPKFFLHIKSPQIAQGSPGDPKSLIFMIFGGQGLAFA